MNINLGNLFGTSNGQNIDNVKTPEELQLFVKSLGIKNDALFLQNLSVGDILRGTVLGKNGDGSVSVKMSGGETVNARMNLGSTLTPGISLDFEVRSKGENDITLAPLSSNLSSDQSIIKALSLAGIPINEKTIEMTDEMMNQGMNIGRDSLCSMLKNVNSLTEASPSDVVLMTGLKLPLTKENAEAFEIYKNNTNVLKESFEDISRNFTADLETVYSEKGADGLGKMFSNLASKAFPEEITDSNELSGKSTSYNEETEINAETGKTNSAMTVPENAEKSAADSFFAALKLAGISDKEEIAKKDNIEDKPVSLGEELNNILKEAGKAKEGDFAAIGEKLSRLLKEEDFPREFTKLLMKKTGVVPEDFEDGKSIKEAYEKVLREIKSLSETVNLELKNPQAEKPLSNMARNVEFLNDLNQAFSYVQLPIKMNGEHANGDLYVYSKKKRLTENDTDVTAVLHLGMDFLGNLDIFVKLHDNAVNTRFYLENEDLLDFMESHMDELDERLKSKGYSLSSKVLPVSARETGTPFDEMIKDSSQVMMGKSSRVLLERQAFEALV